MAKRRMFSVEITESDAFTSMPSSTQNLYFHLGMNADDDGVVNNPRALTRFIGANDDDLKLLIAKRFIIPIDDSGIIVIKHWKINNYIQKDRYTPSKYQQELKLLGLDENGAYKLMDTNCIQNGYTGKVRIGKDSKELGKVRDIDITRYNEIKENGFSGELFLKLVECEYISLYELDYQSYIDYFKELLEEIKDIVDIKIHLEYFIHITCHSTVIGTDKNERPVFGYRYVEENQISNKFIYFKTALDNSWNHKEWLTEEEVRELEELIAKEKRNRQVIDEDEDTSDDDMPF